MTWNQFTEGALIVLTFACWGTVTWCLWALLRRPKDEQPIRPGRWAPDEPTGYDYGLPEPESMPDSVPDWMTKERR
jgi:hypothetical protein